MHFIYFGLIFFLSAVLTASPMQYCRVDLEEGVDFCASFSSYANPSSGKTDLYVRTSTKFRNKLGWSAVGTGETMTGALMFVFYPTSATNDEATVSVRTARGHYSPKLAQNAPDYEVLNVTVKDEYYDILVVCYSCDEWAGSTVDITSTEQSMIYSMQVHQKMQTSDKEAHIKMHTDYNQFEIDMTRVHSVKQLVLPEFVDNGRQTSGLGAKEKWLSFNWHKFHGIAMIIAFTILMPSAVIYLRSGMPRAFTVHWMVQTAAIVIAFMSAAYAMAKSWGSFEGSLQSHLTQHMSLGTIIILLILVQPLLGHYHHILYIEIKRQTLISSIHVWMGRVIVALAWINTALGFKTARASSTYVAGWLISLGIVVLSLIWAREFVSQVRSLRGERQEAQYNPVPIEDIQM